MRYALTFALLLGTLLAVAPAAMAAPPRSVSISWVGDIAFSRDRGLPRHPASVFRPVRRWLRSADVSTGNLEGTLGHGGTTKCGGNCFAFQAPPRYAGVFRRAGFDLMNLANNHSNDAGPHGIRMTRRALRHAGLHYTGLRGQITVRRVNGTRVAFVGFAPYPWASPLTHIPRARKLVRRAARRADVVVVDIHAGAEGAGAQHTPHHTEYAFGENRGNPRRFAHAVVRAGADAVLGSGPHVLRGMECYRHAVVAYSLGNFVGYHTLSTSGVLSLSGVLQVRLGAGGRFLGGRLHPVRLHGPGVPRRDSHRRSIRLVRRLSREDFGHRACRISRRGIVRPR